MPTPLLKIAEVIRSKNSGPYELTLDIIFRDWEIFRRVCAARLITPERIAGLYRVPVADVLAIIEFEPAKAIKINLRRPIPSGSPGDTDVYGAQQHAPLLDLEFELP
ncbi:uncharacterized protein DUF4387 [Hydrogenispora ethanolica]|uniref:Uncharacterized protein DUF4387 n=1 Tax=Hydrogenispora ethanolica TaxID=1082276 RepID=A0A4R1R9T9_HYDET|nr:DUF4387 domain-containing protein [Hydrogenispora ethanolica]TCL62456.1 uncharacterized protein DUF4387 [Hydrogenispora ethanolica]